MKQFHLTLGSKEILTKVVAQHNDRNFLMLKPFENETDFLLLDFSDLPTVFKAGLSFNLLEGKFELLANQIYCLDYFSLDTNQQKEFQQSKKQLLEKLSTFVLGQKPKRDFEFLLITNWSQIEDYQYWKSQQDIWQNRDLLNSNYVRYFNS
ncbi:hypothetical protein [Liquorilactobacillus nagelii]|uniref:hypothetical protein n=1 Tax=Liquorilactobacillus nagelii TaxID=82688 RepID=UPI0024315C00|nr:hypothetical protein [Liquorilactobacillus nagelii]MCI1699562.1 hypothetical protein [Liquorilactobacillus nagelii]